MTREESKQLKGILDLIQKDLPYFEVEGVAVDAIETELSAENPPRGTRKRRVPEKKAAPQRGARSANPAAPISEHSPEAHVPRHPRPTRNPEVRDDAVELSSGFHEGNMPAFLTRR